MVAVRNICVFCGAAEGNRPVYAKTARALGQAIAERGLCLVYGAGNVGLMGMLAESVLSSGGEVLGVIPEKLVDRELAHQGLTELHIVETMHDRKAKMHSLSDAYIALPGGIGTMEEFFEAVTWRQLGYHNKPVALLNVSGFYDGVDSFFTVMQLDGFLHSDHRNLFFIETDVVQLLDRLVS